jgi:predicted ATPase
LRCINQYEFRIEDEAVKFHVFVLQVNGDVTGHQESDSQKVQTNPTARHLIREFSVLLQEEFAVEGGSKWRRRAAEYGGAG